MDSVFILPEPRSCVRGEISTSKNLSEVDSDMLFCRKWGFHKHHSLQEVTKVK
jgi:hypothetical protein